MNLEELIRSVDFKKEFWEWFDLLPEVEKKKFWYYGSDMAEIFFYNKIYSKKFLMSDNLNG